MDNRTVELRVGVTVIAALVILILGVMWLKDYRYSISRYQVKTTFPSVGVLGPGDPVTVSGVEKGRVENVELYKGDVLVTFNLTEDVKLKEDARFRLANVGLMGERVIDIQTGYSEKELDLTQVHKGSYEPGIAEIMGLTGNLVDQTRSLIRSLEIAIGGQKSPSTLETAIDNLNIASVKLNSLLGQADQFTQNMTASSNEVRKFITENKASLQTTVNNFEQASTRLDRLTTSLENTLNSLNNLTVKMEKGEGTLGHLVQDSTLYFDVKRMVYTTDSLLTDIRKHPKKYFHFSIF